MFVIFTYFRFPFRPVFWRTQHLTLDDSCDFCHNGICSKNDLNKHSNSTMALFIFLYISQGSLTITRKNLNTTSIMIFFTCSIFVPLRRTSSLGVTVKSGRRATISSAGLRYAWTLSQRRVEQRRRVWRYVAVCRTLLSKVKMTLDQRRCDASSTKAKYDSHLVSFIAH